MRHRDITRTKRGKFRSNFSLIPVHKRKKDTVLVQQYCTGAWYGTGLFWCSARIRRIKDPSEKFSEFWCAGFFAFICTSKTFDIVRWFWQVVTLFTGIGITKWALEVEHQSYHLVLAVRIARTVRIVERGYQQNKARRVHYRQRVNCLPCLKRNLQ